MNFSDMFGDLLYDRTVVPSNELRQFQCPFHPDGDKMSSWSAFGYPDGTAYCQGCKTFFNVVDLEVRRVLKRCVTGGERIGDDKEMAKLYAHLLNEDPRFESFRTKEKTTGAVSFTERRHFTQLERQFLWRVYDLMRRALMGRTIPGRRNVIADYEALAYLEERGCGPLECIGVARGWQMPLIHRIAKELGDETLPFTTGIESRNEKYKGRMNFLLKDSVVVFRFGNAEEVQYYQARTLTTHDTPYYVPHKVAKMPLMFGTGPTLAAEGFFTIAGFVNEGFTVMAFLGHAPKYFPAPMFKPLDGGIYIADQNPPDVKTGKRAGTQSAQEVYNKVAYSGWHCQIVYPSKPFKQADEWAKNVTWKRAAKYLHSRLDLTIDYGLQKATSAQRKSEEVIHDQSRMVRTVGSG